MRRRKPLSWNLYAYVNGDPVTFNDPRGLSSDMDDMEDEDETVYDVGATFTAEGEAEADGDDEGEPGDEAETSEDVGETDTGTGKTGDDTPVITEPKRITKPKRGRRPGRPKECEPTTLSGFATYYNLVGNKTASGQMFNPDAMTAAMYQPGTIYLGDNVTVQVTGGSSVSVTINDTGPFARGGSGAALQPLRPDPSIIIDLTPAAFIALAGSLNAGKVQVSVSLTCP